MENEILINRSRQKRTEDEMIGKLCFNSTIEKWDFTFRDDYMQRFAFSSESKDKVICIILESPHKYEFEVTNLSSIKHEIITSRPLNNPLSRKNLYQILNSLSFSDEFSNRLERLEQYDVVLLNAIQYQCSLGEDTSKYRDDAFILNWIELQDYFIERIRALDPRLIINCCTKGTWRNEKYIDESRLSELGIIFNTESPEFSFPLSMEKKDFTLKDLIETKLIQESIISTKNYFKFNHPSAPLTIESCQLNPWDKKVLSINSLFGASRKSKPQKKITKDYLIEAIIDYSKSEVLSGVEFFIVKPGTSLVLTTAICAKHLIKDAVIEEYEIDEDEIFLYENENFELVELMNQTIKRHNDRLKFNSNILNCLDDYLIFNYPPAEYTPYGFDPEYDFDEFENSSIHPLIDTTRNLLRELSKLSDEKIVGLRLQDLFESDILDSWFINAGFHIVLELDDEGDEKSYVSYKIRNRELKFVFNSSFLDKSIENKTFIPEDIINSNAFGEYLHAAIKRNVEGLTGFEFTKCFNYYPNKTIEFHQ